MYDHCGQLAYSHKEADGEGVTQIRLQNGQAVAKWTGTKLTYLHLDHIGTPVRGTHGDPEEAAPVGSEVFHDFTTPYGLNPTAGWRADLFASSAFNPATGLGSNAGVTGFTGHPKDWETGLTYMQARHYDPVAGRFLSADPVGISSTGRTGMFNRYGYTENDPVNFTDPFGLSRCRGGRCTSDGQKANRIIRKINKRTARTPNRGRAIAASYLKYAQAASGPPTSSNSSNTTNSHNITNPVPGASLRTCAQGGGCGHFGARRVRGGVVGTHNAVHILAAAGVDAVAPINGTVTKLGYANPTLTNRYVRITDSTGNLVVTVMYVTPSSITPGQQISQGALIGKVENSAGAYGIPAAANHVHFEVRSNGVRVDPVPLMDPSSIGP